MPRLSRIGFKLSALASLFVLGLIASMTRALMRQAEASVVSDMQVRAEFFARSCREAMLPTVDRFALHFQTQEMLKEKAVVFASVTGPEGRVLSHSDPRRLLEVDDSPVLKRTLSEPGVHIERRPGASGLFDIAAPIQAGGRTLGVVRLGLTDTSLTRSLADTRRRLVALALGAAASAAAGMALLVAWIMRPLPRLARFAAEIGSGRLDAAVACDSWDELGELSRSFNEMAARLRERERLRSLFGRFVSPEVAEMALRGASGLAGARREVSVLMCDLRGFTLLSERLAPEEVVRLLDAFFSAMVVVIREHGGMVDKFIGDGLLAVFGAPAAQADHARRAVACALSMRQALERLNGTRRAEGQEPLRMGIAINSGEAVAGTVGSRDRMEYTVVGDTVNLASRLESLNIKFGTEALVAEGTYLQAGSGAEFVPLGLVAVRGRLEPVRVYQLKGAKGAERGSAPSHPPYRKCFGGWGQGSSRASLR